MTEERRILISGGGTGGHIFPAIAIANAIRRKMPQAQFLFVGAEGRMEMQRVPAAGYDIVGLPVRGLLRPLYSPRNVGVMVAFLRSQRRVRQVLRTFRPQVAVGVGGYASAPTLTAAAAMGIPCLIQEQNSFAGVANRSLARKAQRVCVAYDGMERFFPKEKLVLTGNPVRRELLSASWRKDEAVRALGGSPARKTMVVMGGSLGARTLNESMLAHVALLAASPVNVLWQTGAYYYKGVVEALGSSTPKNIIVTEFISDMSAAYAAADLVVSRAGASSISEITLLGKAAILVPSPNVAEDHQTHNALALVERDAAVMVKDGEAQQTLVPLALALLADDSRCQRLGAQAATLALPAADERIADEVLRLITTE